MPQHDSVGINACVQNGKGAQILSLSYLRARATLVQNWVFWLASKMAAVIMIKEGVHRKVH